MGVGRTVGILKWILSFFFFSFAVAHVINDIVFKKMVKVKRCGGGPGGNC